MKNNQNFHLSTKSTDKNHLSIGTYVEWIAQRLEENSFFSQKSSWIRLEFNNCLNLTPSTDKIWVETTFSLDNYRKVLLQKNYQSDTEICKK